jgi:hypothetical protein
VCPRRWRHGVRKWGQTMATFDDKATIDKIIAGNGWSDPSYAVDGEDGPADPPVIKIVEYTNAEGRQTWGVVFENELRLRNRDGSRVADRYEVPTQYVRNPKVIWRRAIAH